MRPDRLLVPQQPDRSFDLRHERLPGFTNPWHFHPEMELNYVVTGTGMRFIGHAIERFSGGGIVLLGSNLPHYWKSDAVYPDAENATPAEAIIVRFDCHFVGEPFWKLPETSAIHRLLGRAGTGLSLREPLRTEVANRLFELLSLDGFAQLAALLEILDRIARSDAVASISPGYLPHAPFLRQSERLTRVIGYLMQHVEQPVSLSRMADIASMNPAAFCRYFKSQTGQTLTQFVTGLRIGYACDLLTRTDDSITLISERAGFDNVSYFVQTFRKMRGITPARFRQQLRP